MLRSIRRSYLNIFYYNLIRKITACIAALCLLIFMLHLRSDDSDAATLNVENPERISNNPLVQVVSHEFVAVVLVMCATRAEALRNHMTQLLGRRPSAFQFPVVISQDGSNVDVKEIATEFSKNNMNVTYMKHDREAQKTKKASNYPAIAKHYKWALDKIFTEYRYDYAIITEDDLDIGDDFFSYFRWSRQVLMSDNTLWCASAWNDNGLSKLIDSGREDKIWRTDFFPGLGWMLSKELWEELSPNFPQIYWDDWMRTPEIRKSRSCLRPEISRTSHNMRLAGKGSSGGMYKDFLSKIVASRTDIDFLLIPKEIAQKSNYDKKLIEQIQNAKSVDATNLSTVYWDNAHDYKVSYKTVRDWNDLAGYFHVMADIRGGMQRTAYYGVVPVMHSKCRVYLIPHSTLENPQKLTEYMYDPLWDKQNRFIEFEKYYCKSKKYTGKCDPKNPELIAFFTKKGWKKRLQDWGDMVVV